MWVHHLQKLVFNSQVVQLLVAQQSVVLPMPGLLLQDLVRLPLDNPLRIQPLQPPIIL